MLARAIPSRFWLVSFALGLRALRVLPTLVLLATLVFLTGELFAAPTEEQVADEDIGIGVVEPSESVEVTDDPIASTAETLDEQDQEERAWGDWRVRIGAIFLARSDPPAWHLENYMFYRDDIVNAADLDFPVGPASDIELRLPGSVVGLDFRYFGVSQTIADTGPLPGDFNYFHHFYVRSTSSYQRLLVENHFENRASLSSSLQSAELNLRREVYPSVALLAGFRYAQFREQWAMSTDNKGTNTSSITRDLDTNARNELFGFQIGSEALLYSFRRLSVEGALKAGIFGNAASSSDRFSLRYNGPGFGGYRGTDYTESSEAQQGAVAFVGDINLSAGVQLTRSIALRGGYQLLWLAGVATATDQLSVRDYSPMITWTNGSMFFHGATVALECGW